MQDRFLQYAQMAGVRGGRRGWAHRVPVAAEQRVQVDALEADVVVHGAHAQRRALQDVVLADLQQVPERRQAAHGRLRTRARTGVSPSESGSVWVVRVCSYQCITPSPSPGG